MSNFREMTPQWLQYGCPKNLKLLKYEYIIYILYIALKQIIWRFRICNYICEMFKFLDFMNTLRNFAESVLLVFSRNLHISRNNLY